ncbi:putative glycosyltransferase [Thermus oshimai JL-2]|uniref:Putative glycosyltransferase n=1 Tax=Thermus oshimai JL-2 TaxID=751945 RepID=K7QY79_THEOS|nr:glycosyltransferase family A protein [Thermus oshimai]AFV75540.1 putative glycosyltransferase [Thermus oshimai JL-2]
MRFSLIVATRGRTFELLRFLDSLLKQTFSSFEVVIVDQNEDERVASLLDAYRDRLVLTHLRASPGASRARNLGANHARGEILTFPDDDCWYPPDLLARVDTFFCSGSEWHGLTGMAVDEEGRPSVGRWAKRAGPITRWNEWTRSAESVIFLRREVFVSLGGFDERLGPGAGTPWASCEGDDLLLRALERGFRLYYTPEVRVYHPDPLGKGRDRDPGLPLRALAYGRGMGYVLRKHGYPLPYAAYHLLRPLGGALWAWLRLDPHRARYHLAVFQGRVRGWLGRP